MRYRLDRIDFSEATHCALCDRSPRPLRTGMAYIVVDEDGKEHAAGPSCAERKTINGKTKPPDFTRGSLDVPEEVAEPGKRTERQGGRTTAIMQSDHDKAVEYIRLRAEKLADIPQVQHPSITHFYRKWKQSSNHHLDDESVRSILTIMNDISKALPFLEVKRLQTVYAFDRWLTRVIAIDSRKFIVGIRDHLRKTLRLTPKQIETANTIFASEIPDICVRIPRMNPRSFI